jgi:hypothetical protein
MLIAALLSVTGTTYAHQHEVLFQKGHYKNYVSQEDVETGEKMSSLLWEGQRMVSENGRCYMVYQSADGFVETKDGNVVTLNPKVVRTKLSVSCNVKTA